MTCLKKMNHSPAERSFSKLKIIKNYLRSTSGQQSTPSLALLSIERGLTFDGKRRYDL